MGVGVVKTEICNALFPLSRNMNYIFYLLGQHCRMTIFLMMPVPPAAEGSKLI